MVRRKMTTKHKLVTADELLLMPNEGRRLELIRGVLSEKVAPGYLHGFVGGRICGLLFLYGESIGYDGLCVEPHYRLESRPDTVRAPDVSWISPGRVPQDTVGYPELAPDLAVEIKSPSNTYAELADKAAMWLRYGSRQVWMADPVRVTVTVYRPGIDPVTLTEDDELDGGDLLPGFSTPVWKLFRQQK